eukprot:TRINITY_DN1655_c0_g1_i9.p1 TRINITY_DN1655_c0_g1~~TRINITY_DN1655_c0_g1_i9.p1  ORF type:complete len:133 (+),score=18.45 TRINITY_DN1655_c0_g1_i9:40-438(+)
MVFSMKWNKASVRQLSLLLVLLSFIQMGSSGINAEYGEFQNSKEKLMSSVSICSHNNEGFVCQLVTPPEPQDLYQVLKKHPLFPTVVDLIYWKDTTRSTLWSAQCFDSFLLSFPQLDGCVLFSQDTWCRPSL